MQWRTALMHVFRCISPFFYEPYRKCCTWDLTCTYICSTSRRGVRSQFAERSTRVWQADVYCSAPSIWPPDKSTPPRLLCLQSSCCGDPIEDAGMMCSDTMAAPCLIGASGGALTLPVTAPIVGFSTFMATASAISAVRCARLPLPFVSQCLHTPVSVI